MDSDATIRYALSEDDGHIDAHRDDINSQARQLFTQSAQIVAVELTGDSTMRVER